MSNAIDVLGNELHDAVDPYCESIYKKQLSSAPIF